MLKETLNIRKLGALDDTGVVEISPLTVFIGNSASGKRLQAYIFAAMQSRNQAFFPFRMVSCFDTA